MAESEISIGQGKRLRVRGILKKGRKVAGWKQQFLLILVELLDRDKTFH